MEQIKNIVLGDDRIYKTLYNKINNNLYDSYSMIIQILLDSKIWSNNEPKNPRVPWQHGRSVRSEHKDLFSKSGIYLWGVENIPLYIGKTKQSFNKRFSRYIWSKKSQCNLALNYENELKNNGINGFPEEIMEWYKQNYGGSARLQGAVAFAKHGLNSVWFSLFPADDLNTIDYFEEKIIPVANEWNVKNGLRQLLNIQFN